MTFSRSLAGAVLLVVAQAPALAATFGNPADTAAAKRPVERADLEAYIDGVLAAQMAAKHVVGAEVAVVKDGQVLLVKGYGYSDLAKRAPVDPARTLFRPGSVTKLFTWTSVMQLVEANKLDLNADVNQYLDFKLPATFAQPITLRHIMTHSAGFEEDSRDLVSEDPASLMPLGRWLSTHMPKRVRAPGNYTSYSNYATALAGYIVERVSGEPWADYIEHQILTPLGMTHTTGVQPLPAALAGDMSVGYKFTEGEYQPKKFEILLGGTPAGALSTTAADMAKFMMAHLANGTLNGTRILGDSIAQVMHTQAMTHDPRIPGFALGFYEQSSHGLRVFGHGGDTQWFHTNLALIPSERLGIFVTFNTDQGGALTESFTKLVLDHYFRTPVPVTPTVADAVQQAERVAGEYLSNRHSYTTYQKMFALTGFAWDISVGKEGVILVSAGGEAARWVPVGPLLYREEVGNGLLAFKADESGRVIRAFLGDNPTDANERLAWYESPKLHLKLLGISAAIFLLTLLAGIARFVRARTGRRRPEDTLPGRVWLYGISLANLAFVALLKSLASDPTALLFGKPTTLIRSLALPVVAVLCTVAALAMMLRQWRTAAGTLDARLRYGAVVVAAVVFAWSLNQWNLLGWRM